jgi:indolepyruvate ferredoxin oxidoreductase beta subunit
VLTEWLVDIAQHAGYAAQSTSIPGVRSALARRLLPRGVPGAGGATGRKRPVFSLNPVPGGARRDGSSELLETGARSATA